MWDDLLKLKISICKPNLPSSRCGSCGSVSRSPDARPPPVASLRCSQSRLASSSPFPIHPKGLNPSHLAPALRPPVCPLLLRPPAPVQQRAAAFASRPGLHGHLCPVGCAAPNTSSAPTTAEPKPSARPHPRQRPPLRQCVLPPVLRLPDPAAAPAGWCFD
ncbi:hypothetical protein SORBI_3004G276300 [Sorghum bicolor]|uniref:Uncharacterized protein n=1 Tax=Sorghum bicolor TaxID=4558 RepID=A0A194YRW6_SORBI|nr:hypothetical protein SORBI_3004G276300 [Sorghum bicolor]